MTILKDGRPESKSKSPRVTPRAAAVIAASAAVKKRYAAKALKAMRPTSTRAATAATSAPAAKPPTARTSTSATPTRPSAHASRPTPRPRTSVDAEWDRRAREAAERGDDYADEPDEPRTPTPIERIAAIEQVQDKVQRMRRARVLLNDARLMEALAAAPVGMQAEARDRLRALGALVADFNKALGNAEKSYRRQQKAAQRQAHGGDVYGEHDGHLVHYVGRDMIPIAALTGQIVEEHLVDDGAEQRREYVIEGTTASGEPLGRITVSAADFAMPTASWVETGWGGRAVVYDPRELRAAVKSMSSSLTTSIVLAHIGWRRVGDRLVYVTAGGAIGAGDVEVRVRLDGALSRYRLPATSATPEDVIAAVRLSLRILDVAPDRVGIPGLAATYRAPLSEWLVCDVVVWLHGPSGALKSSLAAALVGHYGADFDRTRLTASWEDTPAALEDATFRSKDALVVIDDCAPRESHDSDEHRRKAYRVVRNVGNGASRGRMRRDMARQMDRPPRALVMSTAEDVLAGQSTSARLLPIEMRHGDVKLDVLREIEAKREALPLAMRAYIEYVAARVTSDADFARELRREFERLRASFAAVGHLRAPAAAAHLMIGWRMLLDFAEHVGAIDAAEAQRLTARADVALREELEAQASATREEDPVDRWLDWLGSLIAAGRAELLTAWVDPRGGLVPAGPNFIGWRLSDGRLHLVPKVTYALVARAMRDAGEPMAIRPNTLWRRLRDAKKSACDSGRCTTRPPNVGGDPNNRPHVIELLAGALDDNATAAAEAANAPDAPAPAHVAGARPTSQDQVGQPQPGVRAARSAPVAHLAQYKGRRKGGR